MTFELYPAIDILGGKCVRLTQGDFSKKKVYGADPVAQALHFESEGAKFIHIVDLDAAKTGEPLNRPVIKRICEEVSAFVQVGGGVRTPDDAKELSDLGVGRVVVGTVAVQSPELLLEMSKYVAVAAGLDAKASAKTGRVEGKAERKLAIKGWTTDTDLGLNEAALGLLDLGVQTLVVTDIGSDGMLDGPDVAGLRELLELLAVRESPFSLVASGGVRNLSDLQSLSQLQATALVPAPAPGSAPAPGGGKARLSGAIVGKAIYEGTLDLKSALEELSVPTQQIQSPGLDHQGRSQSPRP